MSRLTLSNLSEFHMDNSLSQGIISAKDLSISRNGTSMIASLVQDLENNCNLSV